MKIKLIVIIYNDQTYVWYYYHLIYSVYGIYLTIYLDKKYIIVTRIIIITYNV